MRKCLLFIAFLLSTIYAYTQDIIVRTNGEIINCKITKTDSSTVYFNFYRNGHYINTSIDKSQIKEIRNSNALSSNLSLDSNKLEQKPQHSVTIGILEGGGSLIGADFEVLLLNNFGLQAGAGLFGFGAGLDLHFKPKIRSSFISLQYWHQGVGSSYSQSLLGPSFVFRGKKWFSFQIGLGFALEKGPAWPTDIEQPPIMLTYAIGGYFPW